MEKPKKILLFLFALILATVSAYSTDFYNIYDLRFPDEVPESVYALGAQCTDSQCSDIKNEMELYNGDAIACIEAAKTHGDVDTFNNCMAGAKVTGNIIDMDKGEYVVTKTNVPTDFGTLTWFSAEGDTYFTHYKRFEFFTCDFEVCIDFTHYPVTFERGENAIAELSQVDVRNIENRSLPVMVDVKLSVDETVCSAFYLTQPQFYRPDIPEGYSDFDANTRVTLNISNDNTGEVYKTEDLELPIEADTCAALAAFKWEPTDDSLEGEEIRFELETHVIDEQVEDYTKDYMKVIETLYPIFDGTPDDPDPPTDPDPPVCPVPPGDGDSDDYDPTEDAPEGTGMCWVRTFDYVLTNVQSTQPNVSVAQIRDGEKLYAVFRSEAYMSNLDNPIDYRVQILYDDDEIYDEIHHSEELEKFSVHLNPLVDIEPGVHAVKLITTPQESSCTYLENVIQVQTLHVLDQEELNINMYVRDENGDPIEDAEVEIELVESDMNYIDDPEYFKTSFTDSDGELVFTNLFMGHYEYEVMADGYVTVRDDIHVGESTLDLFITMFEDNLGPKINLPNERTANVGEEITLDLSSHILDPDDDFEDLDISIDAESGANANFDGRHLRITTSSQGSYDIEVMVEDNSGESASDTFRATFVSEGPLEVSSIRAEPDDGEAPFTTKFDIRIDGEDLEDLDCRLYFGDGFSETDSCDDIDGVEHTYNRPGTYTARLKVYGDTGLTQEATENVFVYERSSSSSSTTLSSSLPQSLENAEPELTIDDTINSGFFTFQVNMENERERSRELSFEPVISCGGINIRHDDGVLNTFAISQEDRANRFFFNLDTQDFRLNIPKNQLCEFKVNVEDEFGYDVELSEDVTFT